MRPIIRTREEAFAAVGGRPRADRHVVVDVETTGLSPRQGHRVIEIGAVAIEEGAIVGEFASLIDAGVPVPYAVQAIHGITDEMLAGQPTPEQVLPLFYKFIRDSVLIAHNAAFDVRFLRHEFARLGMGLPTRTSARWSSAGAVSPPFGPHPGDRIPPPLPRRRPPPSEPPRPRRRPDDGQDLAETGGGMSRRELQDVVIEGRSENLEFKRATEKRTEAARTVSAMRNGMGGFVVRLTPARSDNSLSIKRRQTADWKRINISTQFFNIDKRPDRR